MRIRGFDTATRVLLVAEIGNNHEGNFSLAERLVDSAADCGADAVKFQTFRTEYYTSRFPEDRFRRLKGFELSGEDLVKLSKRARNRGLLFFSTPFDLDSVDVLESLVDAYKVASGDLDFPQLLEKIASKGKPVLLSTGMSDEARVRGAVERVERVWREREINAELEILHCVSAYPVPPQEANLASIPFLMEKLGRPVGYSDHTLGAEAVLAATALGARVIEKHFTLDRHLSDFRDHRIAADPGEMKFIAETIHASGFTFDIEARGLSHLMGRKGKFVLPCEADILAPARRSLVAARALTEGHRMAPGDITWIRPAGGLEPGREELLLGRRLRRAIEFGEMILETDVE